MLFCLEDYFSIRFSFFNNSRIWVWCDEFLVQYKRLNIWKFETSNNSTLTTKSNAIKAVAKRAAHQKFGYIKFNDHLYSLVSGAVLLQHDGFLTIRIKQTHKKRAAVQLEALKCFVSRPKVSCCKLWWAWEKGENHCAIWVMWDFRQNFVGSF